MTGRTHRIKVWPEFFAALLDGTKTFEVRRDDRGYAVGDVLVLQEWDPHYFTNTRNGSYTDQEMEVLITYKLPGGRFGLDPNWCVLGFGPFDPEPDDDAVTTMNRGMLEVLKRFVEMLGAYSAQSPEEKRLVDDGRVAIGNAEFLLGEDTNDEG